ncbi:MAG: GNAT family N-acetyltransferase [Pseudomonadales bacterium]|nr:GNAT family N-acetyltransferase [Pseudomonadales bacterium]
MDWTLYPIQEFNTHRDQWDQLNQKTFQAPTLNSAFVGSTLKHFSSGDEKLALYGNPQRPAAATIVQKDKFGVWSTFQPSQNPLGAWLQDQTNTTEELAKKLIKTIPGMCLIMGITQQDPDLQIRPQQNKSLNTIDYITTARVTIDDSFENYWAKRGKNLRQNLRRQLNRLRKEQTEVVLKCITDADQVYDAVTAYGLLEIAGWKNQSGTAVNIHNAQGRFYVEMLEEFCRNNQGRIYQYWYDDKLVSSELCITGHDEIIILKTTYDESIRTSSPTMLMRKEVFEKIFSETALSRIEFYGPVMDWHTKWTNDIRTMYHANICRYSLLS